MQLDPPLARTFDPPTSHEAAARVGEFQASHDAKIFAAICNTKGGATYREIAAAAHLEPVAVARRLSSMERRKLVTRLYDGPKIRKRLGMALWFRAWQTEIKL